MTRLKKSLLKTFKKYLFKHVNYKTKKIFKFILKLQKQNPNNFVPAR